MKKKIALTTVIGYIIGIACVIISIMGAGHFSSFVNWPSVFITIGSTLGVTVCAFPSFRLKNLGKVMWRAFQKDEYDLEKDIEVIVELSEVARRKGILALEDVAAQYEDDQFLHKGILLIADGVGEDVLKTSLEMEMYFSQKRHKQGHAMLDLIADMVTSLGLLGTYIGLIPMLENLENPTTLGPLMALELVTSFYGAFVSYIMFSPLSKKLKTMSEDEVFRKEVLIQGLVSIQEGQNPRIIQEELISCLTKKERRRKSNKDKDRMRELNMKEVA